MFYRGLSRRRSAVASLVALILFSLSVSVIAFAAGSQSGRRVPKKNDPPAPVQGAQTEEPPAETTKKPEQPRLAILVVHDSPTVSTSEYLAAVALDGVSERLRESSALAVERTKGLNRKEAGDRAKNSKGGYVLWIELDFDSMMTGSVSRRREMTINFVLFAPVSGNVSASGRVYERPYQPSAGGVPIPVPSGQVPLEYIIRQTAQEVADRVMGALKVSSSRR